MSLGDGERLLSTSMSGKGELLAKWVRVAYHPVALTGQFLQCFLFPGIFGDLLAMVEVRFKRAPSTVLSTVLYNLQVLLGSNAMALRCEISV